MTDYPLRGGVCVNGLPVGGIYHAGRRIGLTHDGALLVPSGKNLMRYDAYADANAVAGIRADGGLDITLKQSFRAWYAITWSTQLSDAGLAAGDTITASCAGLIAHHYMSIRFQRGGDLIGETPYLAIDRPFVSTSIPGGTTQIVTQLFTDADFTEDRHFTIHPQLERGSARTCWEPPENLRGGGVLKDLNLCGAWDNWGSKFPTWEVSGHTAHVARPDTATKWQARKMSAVTLPAGTYSVRVDITGDAGLAFEVHVGGRVAFYAGSDWRRFTLDQPTEVYVQLAVRPTWTGEATLTPVILEGDWTTT